MRILAPLLFLVAGLAHGAEAEDVILPKMAYGEAVALLEKHHAKSTIIQIAYPAANTNRRIEHFILRDGRTIELSLIRKKKSAGWTIRAIYEVVWLHPGQNRAKEWRELKMLILKWQSPPPETPPPAACR